MTSTLKQEAVLNYSPTKLKACRSSIKKNNAGLLIHQKMISHYLRKSFHSTPRSVWHLKKKLLQFTNILLVVNKTANSSFCFKILSICHKIHKTVILKKKKKTLWKQFTISMKQKSIQLVTKWRWIPEMYCVYLYNEFTRTVHIKTSQEKLEFVSNKIHNKNSEGIKWILEIKQTTYNQHY